MAEKGELMILIAVSQINTILAIAARKFGAGLMQCSTGIAKVRVRLPFRPLSRYCLVALIIVRIIYTFVPKNRRRANKNIYQFSDQFPKAIDVCLKP